MAGRPNPVEALVTLSRLVDPAERLANWRQAMAALGQSLRVSGPPPFEGTSPELLARSAQVALETGLCDDLEFISPASAAVALYELTSALPPGRERRELGRRVLTRLYEGTAGTFAAVAARIAVGVGKSLETPTLRARVALVCDMPIASTVNPDNLTLALVTRPEAFERWVSQASSRGLHERRLAAQLFEHAAREACTRAQQGDSFFCDALRSARVEPVFERLLADREPLVWRHVAVARGLLGALDSEVRERIDASFDPASRHGWQRGAVSLVAGLVLEPVTALAQCRALIHSTHGDAALGRAMLWGLPRVIEAEPDAAEELLELLCTVCGDELCEAAAMLLSDVQSSSFAAGTAARLAEKLAERARADSPFHRAADLAKRALDPSDDSSLRARVRRALGAYESTGALAAHELALEAASFAEAELGRLSGLGGEPPDGAEELAMLGDLDASLLERSRLPDLLLLGRHPGEGEAAVPELHDVYDRLGDCLFEREGMPAHQCPALFERRRELLAHFVDTDSPHADADSTAHRARIKRALQRLLAGLEAATEPSSRAPLTRALATSFDAAVRAGVCEPCDLLLVMTARLEDAMALDLVGQATTHPELRNLLGAHAAFLEPLPGSDDPDELFSRRALGEEPAQLAHRMIELSRGLGGGGSYRGEALRKVVLRLGRSLEVIARIRGASELIDERASGSDPLSELEESAQSLRRLTAGAAQRVLDIAADDEIAIDADIPPISALIERAVSTAVPLRGDDFTMALSELVADLPGAIAAAVSAVLRRIASLPLSVTSEVLALPLERRRASLPDWVLPRRTLGAFYVVRALGSGGISSVFVARRTEERQDPQADAFALKVPQLDPTSARSLSEQEFLQMFREEAGALLSLPQHPNLARFVTFDLAARPKPILVMELIRGNSLDRLIRGRALTQQSAFRYLDGILAGLEAMHGVGIGHLDLKPSNVILRDGETPVLVDFGLSGHHLRPACGTLEYCAPEILSGAPVGTLPPPMPADMYAFGCLAFEVMTTELLFDAEDEMSLIALQLEHDGWPSKLRLLAEDPLALPLATALSSCLRRDPSARPSAAQLRVTLAALAPALSRAPWPFGVEARDAELSA